MPWRKQVILIMEGNQYPFGEAEQSIKAKPNQRVLVRKKHETRNLQERNQLLDKIDTAKSINNPYLMKIENVLEEDNSIHVLYEYVQTCLNKKIGMLSEADVNQVRDYLLDLAVSLADAGIKTDWDIRNIGITDKKEAKYYLDLDRMGLEPASNKSKLQRSHFKVIMDLFAQLTNPPQVQKPKQVPMLTLNKKHELSIPNSKPASPQQSKIQLKPEFPKSRASNSSKLSDTKEKIGHQRSNWKDLDHNEEFMQDFINVLDDKSENAQSKYDSEGDNYQQDQDPDDEDQEDQEDHEDHEDDEEEEEEEHQNILDGEDDEEPEEEQDDDEEIVWVSAPDAGEEFRNNLTENQDEQQDEMMWVDAREFQDIRQRAEQAIKRSTNVLVVFKKILEKNKVK